MRDDPRYVKWIIRFFGKDKGVPYEKVIDYHKCTKEELGSFNPLT